MAIVNFDAYFGWFTHNWLILCENRNIGKIVRLWKSLIGLSWFIQFLLNFVIWYLMGIFGASLREVLHLFLIEDTHDQAVVLALPIFLLFSHLFLGISNVYIFCISFVNTSPQSIVPPCSNCIYIWYTWLIFLPLIVKYCNYSKIVRLWNLRIIKQTSWVNCSNFVN